MNNKSIHQLAYGLLWAGGLNWGLIGLFDYNLVVNVLRPWPNLITLVYVLVGLAAVYTLAMHKDYCKTCSKKKKK